jgi:hypothetical protein
VRTGARSGALQCPRIVTGSEEVPYGKLKFLSQYLAAHHGSGPDHSWHYDLRLVGEMRHWPTLLFNTSAGGGAAIIGIAWLPFIFGPYFALKFTGAGEGPSSTGKAIGFAVLGIVLLLGGSFVAFAPSITFPGRFLSDYC